MSWPVSVDRTHHDGYDVLHMRFEDGSESTMIVYRSDCCQSDPNHWIDKRDNNG